MESKQAMENGEECVMTHEKFHLLMDVLRILEKHERDPEVMESALEIVENFNGSLNQEQKAELLKEVLHFRTNNREADRELRFQEEWKRFQMKDFMRQEFF